MKKILCLMLTLALLISSFAFQAVFAEDDIKVLVNGKSLTMDQPPVLVNDRTLVPVRAIFEALGAKVDWNNDTNTATGVLGSTTVEIQIENTVAKVNGKDVTLDVPAKLISDRTLVPVRFISESLGAKVDWDNDTQTVVITKEESKASRIWTFDDLSSFESGKDFDVGGAYSASKVSLSTEQDHTTGSGKSLKLDKIESNAHRIKIANVFSLADIGKTFTISGWFYAEKEAGIRFGTYSAQGTEFAMSANKGIEVNVPANKWTNITWEYKHENEIVTFVGFDQGKNSTYSDVIYFDDLSVVQTSEDGTKDDTTQTAVKDGHRPVPTNFTTGKSYDDLIYYKNDLPDNETLYKKLPKGKVIVDDSIFNKIGEVDETYGTVKLVDVSDMPFKKALRVNCTKVPEKLPWQFKVSFGNFLEGKANEGDVLLLKLYVRSINVFDDESQTARIMPIIEQTKDPYNKSVNTDAYASQTWTVFYFPFKYKQGYTAGSIRLGYKIQEFEIGGYEITNYENNVDISSLPTNSAMPVYLKKNAQWRKDAWERIEKIRKGTINVIVKDAQGNIIPDAKVDVNMYESDFQWGTAVGGGLLSQTEYGKNYRKTLSENFNTIVTESALKWNAYLKDPELPKNIFKQAKDLGIKNFRGHCLMWDKATVNNGINTAFPDDLPDYFDKYDQMQKIICDHIAQIMPEFKDYIGDWDVFNEGNRDDMRIFPKYGFKMVKEWYDAARATNSGAQLYYNDYTSGQKMVDYVNDLISNGVDFDGVGLQSHYSTANSIEDTLIWWNKIAATGKRMKVTEYGFDAPTKDWEIQASFTRDLMIAAFSIENMDGFVMWGYAGGNNDSKVLYDENFNPRTALSVWQDLVYNKWWTRESGKTSSDGKYSVSGFYGDYDVTASANGKTKTVSASFHKGQDNTITITLD